MQPVDLSRPLPLHFGENVNWKSGTVSSEAPFFHQTSLPATPCGIESSEFNRKEIFEEGNRFVINTSPFNDTKLENDFCSEDSLMLQVDSPSNESKPQSRATIRILDRRKNFVMFECRNNEKLGFLSMKFSSGLPSCELTTLENGKMPEEMSCALLQQAVLESAEWDQEGRIFLYCNSEEEKNRYLSLGFAATEDETCVYYDPTWWWSEDALQSSSSFLLSQVEPEKLSQSKQSVLNLKWFSTPPIKQLEMGECWAAAKKMKRTLIEDWTWYKRYEDTIEVLSDITSGLLQEKIALDLQVKKSYNKMHRAYYIDDTPVGLLGMQDKNPDYPSFINYLYIDYIVALPSEGMGGALVEYAVQISQQYGNNGKILLEAVNQNAKEMYIALGFTPITPNNRYLTLDPETTVDKNGERIWIQHEGQWRIKKYIGKKYIG